MPLEQVWMFSQDHETWRRVELYPSNGADAGRMLDAAQALLTNSDAAYLSVRQGSPEWKLDIRFQDPAIADRFSNEIMDVKQMSYKVMRLAGIKIT
jgi:hypothetical protein